MPESVKFPGIALKVTTAVICVVALAALIAPANEARKEVYYLCGNFEEGVALTGCTSKRKA